ncbi:MAG TPA: arginine--tRNA ligase, partial [candidate division WOR-3 bacterium]|nr:arginine--tRNA ligase [candidate division WOR-3 bacterium]
MHQPGRWRMRQRIKEVLEGILKDYGESVDFKVTRPEDREFGDYTTNLPFLLAKSLRRNPVEIGEEIAKKIRIEGLEVTPVRGFINFRISKGVLQNNLLKAIEEGYGKGEGKGIKINVEFVSANPTGPLHLASARAAAFGDTLVRLLRYKGYTAESEYYVNDAGKQIDNLALSVDARIKEIEGEEYS